MLEGRILPTMSCCSSERHAPRTWLNADTETALYGMRISLLATGVDDFAGKLRSFLKNKRGVKVDEDERIHFTRRRCFKNPGDDASYVIADVMTLLAELRYSDPFTLLIISGHSGCRGTTFKDRGHCTNPESAMHLTDFYVSFPETTSGENIVQTANRISGTYTTQPRLTLWTSNEEWALIQKKQDEIDNIYQVLSGNGLADKFQLVKLPRGAPLPPPPAPPRILRRGKIPALGIDSWVKSTKVVMKT